MQKTQKLDLSRRCHSREANIVAFRINTAYLAEVSAFGISVPEDSKKLVSLSWGTG